MLAGANETSAEALKQQEESIYNYTFHFHTSDVDWLPFWSAIRLLHMTKI